MADMGNAVLVYEYGFSMHLDFTGTNVSSVIFHTDHVVVLL